MTNVLLLVLDSVRARNLSCYGYPEQTTPFLDSFIDHATLYEQARAPGTDSIVSHASMFTGLHAREHGVISSKRFLKEGETIWEDLQGRGYATGAFTSNPFFSDVDVGLTRGFDVVETARDEPLPFPTATDPRNYLEERKAFARDSIRSRSPLRSMVNGLAFMLKTGFNEIPADVFVDRFLEWEGKQDSQWAAMINFMAAHDPYLPESEHDRWGGEGARAIQSDVDEMIWEFVGGWRPWWQRSILEPLYDGAIRQVDSALRELVVSLKGRGVYDDTLIVICGDHGEGFGEESRIRKGARVSQHTIGIHESLLHVPLIVKHPGQESGDVVPGLATLTRFSDVIENCIAGDGSSRDFVPEGPVVSTSIGAEMRAPEKVREYCADAWRYTGDITAVYRERGNVVVKEISWKSERATVIVEDVVTSYRSDASISSDSEEFLASLDEKGVSIRSEDESVSEQTLDRLEELGYR